VAKAGYGEYTYWYSTEGCYSTNGRQPGRKSNAYIVWNKNARNNYCCRWRRTVLSILQAQRGPRCRINASWTQSIDSRQFSVDCIWTIIRVFKVGTYTRSIPGLYPHEKQHAEYVLTIRYYSTQREPIVRKLNHSQFLRKVHWTFYSQLLDTSEHTCHSGRSFQRRHRWLPYTQSKGTVDRVTPSSIMTSRLSAANDK